MNDLTPVKIVEELDKYIIGQKNAKKAVAIALRNRYRRRLVDKDIKEEIVPKNIIMIGHTGVGKTEIARRIAKFTEAPFLKIEASKFTEVGYVGRDVESIIRDLVEFMVRKLKSDTIESVKEKAYPIVYDKILDELLPKNLKKSKKNIFNILFNNFDSKKTETDLEDSEEIADLSTDEQEQMKYLRTRLKLEEMLKQGKLNDRIIELEIKDTSSPIVEVITGNSMEEMGINFSSALGNIFPGKVKKRKLKVKDAIDILLKEESQNLVDMDELIKNAIYKVEESGIVFLDEIDKIAGVKSKTGPDISREGVQRDLLPIIEGTTVMTKYGPVKSDHILFIAAGAFHVSKPSELIPEIQGRFPIRVELDSLTKDDFQRILVEPENALTKQYKALLNADNVELEFLDEAVEEIAKTAEIVNNETENIGARRLHTILEKLLEDILFDSPDKIQGKCVITKKMVNDKLGEIIENRDLSRYIL